ncbi:GntR family transcriptional regulator [Xanthobacter dioxanivorans]|uniref:GntR family transcriptional regulator n=1 Tax=Xanthobacter dioxanivorans TaxID=2528964 RepID=UPI001932D65D|nr:GntR family transcriptional regulator [Xanthobacter dioxanivorans]
MEAELVRAFATSRSPARQALDRLCRDGLVDALTGRGYRVRGLSEGEGAGIAALDPVDLSAPASGSACTRRWSRSCSSAPCSDRCA